LTNTQNTQNLHRWVAAEGNFISLSGRRLRRTKNTLIRGKPIHSHLAERLVYLGNSLKIRGTHNETKDRIAAKVSAAANGTKNNWRAAWDTYEQGEKSHLEENKKPSIHWRDALTGSVSDKHRRPNKQKKRPSSRWRFVDSPLEQGLLTRLRRRPLLMPRRTRHRPHIYYDA
jgi:hypothetical protein